MTIYLIISVDYTFDNAGNQVKTPKSGHDDKNQLSQCKELWIFWYGEKPTQVSSFLILYNLKDWIVAISCRGKIDWKIFP